MKAKILDRKTVFIISDEDHAKKVYDRDRLIAERDSLMPVTENNMTYMAELNESIEQLNDQTDDFYNYSSCDMPQTTGLQGVDVTYILQDESVNTVCLVVENDKDKVNKKIRELKSQLAGGDYKIVKCYESTLVGSQLPYDIQQLHENRQAIRTQINSLESLL